ncbi:MAG: MATE family efflux transporter, partial [Porticoccaceae bacterium]|nr:MATE family efflux transporter [Porticoccaceae bacterium]
GAALNIALDYLFIAVYDWGLAGAAFATGVSQVVSTLVLLSYFFNPQRLLRFGFRQDNWIEVLQAAYNGVSEFINEVSGGIIAFIFNWMLIQRAGVEGVAAITVVNYLLMVGFMAFFAISDTIQVMVSQNFGARNPQRINAFLQTAAVAVIVIGALCIAVLLTASEALILLFLDDQPGQGGDTLLLALTFVNYVWPLFLFAGVNMLISGYLTAIHRPFQSGVIAVCRSLVLPAGLLIVFYSFLSDYQFVAALPVAEGLTFVLATVMYLRHMPMRALRDEHPRGFDTD